MALIAFCGEKVSLMWNSEVLRLNRALKVLSQCNHVLVHASSETQLLNDICRTVIETGGYRMAWVGLAESDPAKTIRPVAIFGADDGYVSKGQFSWDDTEWGRGPTGTAIRTGRPQINHNFDSNVSLKSWRDEAIKRGFRSSSAFPLSAQSENFGVLTIYSDQCEPFGPQEIALLDELAKDLSYGLFSLRLRRAHEESLRRLEKSLDATIHAMAATVEMRDPYTAGHERRVGELAVAIAGELGLSADDIHGLHLAAAVHDLGKIQTPAELLAKPTRLTELEYKLIQLHAQAGYDILKGIDFPWPIAEIVWQHHERLDGSGYPRGLRGEEIHIGAKILAVADVVEAMASHRPYRPARGIFPALDEIKRNRGVLYDEAVVDICIKLFSNAEFAFST